MKCVSIFLFFPEHPYQKKKIIARTHQLSILKHLCSLPATRQRDLACSNLVANHQLLLTILTTTLAELNARGVNPSENRTVQSVENLFSSRVQVLRFFTAWFLSFFKFRAKKFSSIVHLVLPRGFVKVQVTKWEFLGLEGLTVKQIRKDSGKVPRKQDEHELRKQIEFRSEKTRGKSQKKIQWKWTAQQMIKKIANTIALSFFFLFACQKPLILALNLMMRKNVRENHTCTHMFDREIDDEIARGCSSLRKRGRGGETTRKIRHTAELWSRHDTRCFSLWRRFWDKVFGLRAQGSMSRMSLSGIWSDFVFFLWRCILRYTVLRFQIGNVEISNTFANFYQLSTKW